MAFQVFKETGARPKEFISVTEKQAFGMSRAFLDKYGITSDHKAVILYDEDEKKVALHFSTNDPKFGFSVRISNPKHGAIVVAKSFFERKHINASTYAGRYGDYEVVNLREIGMDKDGDAYVIALRETEPVEKETDDEPIVNSNSPWSVSDLPF